MGAARNVAGHLKAKNSLNLPTGEFQISKSLSALLTWVLRYLTSAFAALCLAACIPKDIAEVPDIVAFPASSTESVTISNNPLSLQNAVRLNILAASDVSAAALSLRRSINEITISKAAFYPELYASSAAGTGDGILGNFELGLRYTLYDFGARAATLNSVVAAAQSSRFELVSRIDATSQDAVAHYIAVAIEDTIAETSEAYISQIEELRDQVKSRVNIGIASSVDLNEVEAAYLTAQTALLEARADQEIARQALVSKLGFPVVLVWSPETIKQQLLVSNEQLQSVPDVSSYPRIRALEAVVAQAEGARKAALAGLLPRIGWSVGAAVGLERGEGWQKNGVSNGLEISQVLSLGGGRAEVTANAEIAVVDAQQQLEEERRLLMLEIAQAQIAQRSSSDAFAQRERILSLTIQTRDVMATEYLVGSRSLRDLLDAEESIYRARVSLHEANRTALLGQLRLLIALNLANELLYELPT